MARIKWCIERQKSKTLYKKMVNRTNETVGPAKGLVADDATETFYLRAKNLELAKKLSDMQLQNATLTRDGELLRTALFNEKVRANTYVNKLNDVTNDCRTALAHIVALSNTLTNILSKLSNNNNYASPMLENKNISPLKQKTKAVKPMVSGCTISKPTIKLNRISEQLLQAAVNGESRLEEQSRVHENRIEPVVNIRRLPERLNLEMLRQDMENIEDEEEERIESESERLDPNGLPQTLSTVMENTEDSSNIRNQTTLQQNVTEHSFSIENSTMSRYLPKNLYQSFVPLSLTSLNFKCCRSRFILLSLAHHVFFFTFCKINILQIHINSKAKKSHRLRF